MNNPLTIIGNNMPPPPSRAVALRAEGKSIAGHFSEGVRDSFAVVSFKGKVWRVKYQGVESMLTHPTEGYPLPFLDVVMINASPHISKIWYDKGYTEGDTAAPDCWSVNGVAPDPASPKKQSTTCMGCPQNAFGSKITDNGKKAKACSDSRRVAVMLYNDLYAERLGGPLLLRMPQSSLKNVKEFTRQLEQRGYDPNTYVTRIGFDPQEAYPKMIFQFLQVLKDEEYDKALELLDDERTTRLLEAPVEAEIQHEPTGQAEDPNLPPPGQSPAARRAAAAEQPVSAPVPVASQPHPVVAAATQPVQQPVLAPEPPAPAPVQQPTQPVMAPEAPQPAQQSAPVAPVQAQPAQPSLALVRPEQPVQAPTPAPVKAAPVTNGGTPPAPGQVTQAERKLDDLLGSILGGPTK